MAQPFVGEIRMVGFNFAPQGWAFCNGQLMAISENETLFNLIGTTYGGDGQSTFAMPNLQCRFPMHMGTNGATYQIGQLAGEEQVTLTTNQIPIHSHVPKANSGTGTQSSPSGNVWAASTKFPYSSNPNQNPLAAMATQAVQSSGGSQPHDNMMPFLVINFVISLFGVYPSQN